MNTPRAVATHPVPGHPFADDRRRPLLMRVLLSPAISVGLGLRDWDLLLRQARRANLAGRLAHEMEAGGWLDALPAPVQPHLRSALLLSRRQMQMLGREVDLLAATLSELPGPVILLKGAAYALGRHAPAPGRMFSDIDILIPPAQLPRCETTLLVHGWAFDDELDAYDQRYYRAWMHELPPLHHLRRGTSLDVHHTLLPPTARTPLDSERLFDAPRPLPGRPGVFVLPPEDMLLHSAAHLFHEGELHNGLRDLFDLDALLREFGALDGFWPRLVARAREIGLSRPLWLALRYTRALLNTPYPDTLPAELGPPPGALARRLLDACYRRLLRPAHESCRLHGHELAELALYVRSHWLRMPFGLLALHLGRKAWGRLTAAPVTPDTTGAPDAKPPAQG